MSVVGNATCASREGCVRSDERAAYLDALEKLVRHLFGPHGQRAPRTDDVIRYVLGRLEALSRTARADERTSGAGAGEAAVCRCAEMRSAVAGPRGTAREMCKRCWRANAIGFAVPDEVWRAVVPAELVNRVLCIQCFDEFATERGIEWDRQVELYPVSGAYHRRHA